MLLSKKVDGSPKPAHMTSKGALKKSSTGASKGKASREAGPSETTREDEQQEMVAKIPEGSKQTGQQVAVKGKQVQQSRRKPSTGPSRSGSGGGVCVEESGTSNEEGLLMKEVVVECCGLPQPSLL